MERNIKGFIRTAIAVFVLAATMVSCQKKVITVLTFAPKMEILTTSVNGGEDFSFRIYSNTGSFVIRELQCSDYDGLTLTDFPFTGLSVGSEINCGDDGWAVFEAKNVSVSHQHTGFLNITVEDPKTGDTAELSGEYAAYINFVANGIRILNEDSVLVDGDDFRFAVETNLERFLVQDFYCPFSTGGVLAKGESYTCDKYGNVEFAIPKVKVTESRTDSLWIDIRDLATGKVLHRSAEFEMKTGFSVSMSASDLDSNTGDLVLHFASNRNAVKLKEFLINPEYPGTLFVDGKATNKFSSFGFTNSVGTKINNNSEVVIPEGNRNFSGFGGWDDFTAGKISTSRDQTVSMSATFVDVYETGRSQTVSFSFNAKTYSYPAYFELKDPQTGKAVIIENGSQIADGFQETISPLLVSQYDESSLGKERGQVSLQFVFLNAEKKPITQSWDYQVNLSDSSRDKLMISTSSNTGYTSGSLKGKGSGGTVYFRGTDIPGDAEVNITTVMTGHPDDWVRTLTIPVKVRKRVALVLNATFRQVPELDREDSFLFNAKSSSIEVATWSGPADLKTLKASEVEKRAGLSTIPSEGSGLEVTLKTEAFPATYKSKFFEGFCNVGKFSNPIYGYYYCPGGDITKYGTETAYSGNPFYFKWSGLTYGKNYGGAEERKPYSDRKVIAPQNLTEYLNHWNDCGIWYTHDSKNKEAYEQMVGMDGYFQFLTRWEKFNISVSDIKYDKDKYDFRYVIYKWGTDANPDVYWWGTNSRGYVMDKQGLKDILSYFFGTDEKDMIYEHYLNFIKPNSSTTCAIFSRSFLLENFTGKPKKEIPAGKYPVANQIPWCQEWND